MPSDIADDKPNEYTQPQGSSFQRLTYQQLNKLCTVINIDGGKNNGDKRHNNQNNI